MLKKNEEILEERDRKEKENQKLKWNSADSGESYSRNVLTIT